MKDIVTTIIESLEQLRGKSGPQITNALKRIGGGEDGSMVDGLIQIVSMLNEDKVQCVKNARVSGIVIGAVGTASVIGGIHLYSKHKEKKQCREKMEQVAEILRQEAAIADNESTLSVETEVPTENKDVIPAEANPIA